MIVAASLHKLSPDTGHNSTDNAKYCTLHKITAHQVTLNTVCYTKPSPDTRQPELIH
jgi:hypothetical protein